jgi:N-methylhydantoinase A/oxoprolinase/acetone carboxylase beta subunit
MILIHLYQQRVNKLFGELYKADMPQTFNETLILFRKNAETLAKDLAANSRRLDQFEERVNKDLMPLAERVRQTYNTVQLQLTVLRVMQSQQQTSIDALTANFKNEYDSVKGNIPNLVKLSELARNARNESDSQQQIAEEFERQVDAYTKEAKEAVEVMERAVDRLLAMVRESANVEQDYSVLVRDATDMANESRKLKIKLDEQALKAREVNEELGQFSMPSYDKEIDKANDRINDINQIVNF